MAESPTVRIHALRLRVSPHVLEGGETALRDAVRRQLPPRLEPALAESLAIELAKSARGAARRAAVARGDRT